MSAPDTNVEKQTTEHRPSLLGMSAVVIFALVLLAGLMMLTVERGGVPEGAEAQVDGRTGAIVEEEGQ